MQLSDAEARRLYDQAALMAGIGAWECRLATSELSWTDGVYDLFGLARGSTLHRASIGEDASAMGAAAMPMAAALMLASADVAQRTRSPLKFMDRLNS